MSSGMSPAKFKRLFFETWNFGIKKQYCSGTINSERALQAHLVGLLQACARGIVILVEPSVYRDKKRIPNAIPDLWICDSVSVTALAVVELKYKPFGYPTWKDDCRKLLDLLDDRSPAAAFKVDPGSGQDDNKKPFPTTKATIGIFAVVGKHDAVAVDTRELIGGMNRMRGGGRNAARRMIHAWGGVRKSVKEIRFGIARMSPKSRA